MGRLRKDLIARALQGSFFMPKRRKHMKNNFERFVEEICNNCKNRYNCTEELRQRTDGSLHCNLYEKSEEENIWKDV